jgi:hypothetical protein
LLLSSIFSKILHIMANESLTPTQVAVASGAAGGILASAWSEAASAYVNAVAVAEGQGLVTEAMKHDILAKELSRALDLAAANAKTWAEAAAAKGQEGVGPIMEKYAERYADQAARLASDLAAGQDALGNFVKEANTAIENAAKTTGSTLGQAAGPIIDAAQMAAGAVEWHQTGESTQFGEACAGAALGAALGAIATLGVAIVGTVPVITAAAVIGVAAGIGSLLGPNAFNWFNDVSRPFFDWFFEDLGAGVGIGRIHQAIADFFGLSQRWQVARRDPLTLDLDGDGLETVGASSTNPILFDHDGDGIKNGTGWVKPDDGFLVFDRNGNGTIDTGAELFGDSTPLYAGGLAADGFAALAQEDTNQDGVVNHQDANWSSLKVWRDLNQDGVSQAGELLTLAQEGITSFNVNETANSQVLANGNQIADLGTFTRTDGSSGGMGNVSQMADINLAEDTFHREFTDSIPLAEGVAALPDMQGSGKVRDLHEAASLSSDLQTLLTQYSQATTKAEQLNLMDQMLLAWADTSGMAETMQERAGTDYIIEYQEFGAERKSNFAVDDDSASGSPGSVEGTSPEWAAIVASGNHSRVRGNFFFMSQAHTVMLLPSGMTRCA